MSGDKGSKGSFFENRLNGLAIKGEDFGTPQGIKILLLSEVLKLIAEAKLDFPMSFFVANDIVRMQLLEEWAGRVMDWRKKWFGGSAPSENQNPQGMVRAFHEHCNFTVNESPTLIALELFKSRNRLLREEVDELEAAYNERSLVKIADALGDILYITYGTSVAFGIAIDRVFREIHRSNMTKLPSSERDGKARKGETYSPPDIEPIIKGGSAPPKEESP